MGQGCLRILVVGVVVLIVAACGGGNGDNETQASPTTTKPEQDAGDYMKELIQQSLRGQYGRTWETLHPAHQAVVSRDKYDSCERQSEESAGATKIDVAVVETYKEPIRVEGDGTVESTAVTLRFSYANPLTGKPAEEHATVHAVAVGGEWKWILTPKDHKAYAKGECPPPD
jgi:hypothetical protein